MLKSLLQEVWRSVRPARIEAPFVLPAAPDRSAEFSTSSRERKEELIAELDRDLQAGGGDVEGWTQLGDWCLALDRHSLAEAAFRRALALKPMHGAAQEGLGLALLNLRQLTEAHSRLEVACQLDPGRSDVWVHWGLTELALGNYEQAAKKFQAAIDRNPKNPHGWQNLGLVAYHLGQTQACIDAIREAIALRPEDGLAHANLALALRHKGDLESANASARRATELKPGSARVWVVLADTCFDLAEFEACRAAIERALVLDARFTTAHVALGKLLTARRDWEGARKAFERAIQLQPGQLDAESGIAILELLQARWTTAWDWYEARRQTQPSPVRQMPYPEWDGTARADERVLVHAEQGLGEIVLFASCIPDLISTGVRCALEVPPRLERLFARSFPSCTVLGHEQIRPGLAWLDQLTPVDRQTPIGSLPRWFRRSAEAFPKHAGYLVADPEKTVQWRRRLEQEHQNGSRGPLIGISWRGGLAITAQRHRTLKLPAILDALAGLPLRWVNLQYGDVDAELADCSSHPAGPVHPGLSGYADLDDLAALTAACDAVLTVCTTQAHLTGALGQAGMVLVPNHPNWRYGSRGDRSDWYPSLLLARQTDESDWAGPLAQARHWLLSRVDAAQDRTDAARTPA